MAEMQEYTVEAEKKVDSGPNGHLPMWAVAQQDWTWAGKRVCAMQPEKSGGMSDGKKRIGIGGTHTERVL
jgi:hypothetical protein